MNMNITKNTTFTWKQMGMLKFSVLFIGIAIGANWPAVFVPYTAALVIVGLVAGIYLSVIWYRE
jgi:hypothetical protein